MSVSQPSKWLGIFLFLMLPLFLFSQKTIKNTSSQRCHTDEKMQQLMDADPSYKKGLEEDFSKPKISTSNTFGKSSSVVVTIPVHVIICHPPGQSVGTGVNFPLDHVESQITVLNEDFRRTNADAMNTPSVFAAADVEIEFCLASVDPSGNPTDGITRYATNDNLNSDEFSIKSATGWNRNDYLNIWVGPNLGGILGWAYLPNTGGLPNSTLDGVVTASTTFGGPGYGTNVPYHLGRTTTHEVGHYLGLRHVWGNGGCTSDDNIADTPIQNSSNFGCPNHPSPSCNNGGDMFMNYMDYVNDNCMNAFTTGQGVRMHDILNSSRSSLLGSAAIVCSSSAPLALQLVSQTDVTCNLGNDGSITVLGSGGSGTYTYNIDGGTPQSSNVFTGLTASTYVVEVSDGSSTISMNVTITEPTAIIPIVNTQVDISCFGLSDGSVIVDGVGGTNNGAGYTYNIDGGPFSTNNFFTNLSGGIHTVIVRDENDCEGVTTIVIDEPLELISFVSNQTEIDCSGNNNGQVILGSSGGSPGYLYSFNGGGYLPNNVFTNLSQGIYFVETVDENFCEYSFNVTITEPDILQLIVQAQVNLNCFGATNGLIEVAGQGGTGNLQYQINNQGYQVSPIFENLSGGTYNLDVIDENGCVEGIMVDITEPSELEVELVNQTNVSCTGGLGSITVNSVGGNGTPTVTLNGTMLSGNSVTFNNLAVGIYPIIIEDENNCEVFSSVEITGSPGVDISITTAQNVNCNGENNGMIEAESSGGSGTFTYFLNGVSQGNNNVFTNLPGGTYLVESIDSEGCSDEVSIEITEPQALTGQITQQTNLNCFGENNGTVTIEGAGGMGILNYTLGSETNTTGIFNGLVEGTYSVSVLDENNCETSILVEITQPAELVSNITSQQNIACSGGNVGAVTINSSGGSGAISVDLGGTTLTGNSVTFENLAAGTYPILVTDDNNCQVNLSAEITQDASVELTLSEAQNVSCNGAENGIIEVEANGGLSAFTFFLNGVNQGNNNIFTNLSGGSYLVEITDGMGCDDELTIEITEPDILNAQLDQQTNLDCFEANDGTATVLASGGTGVIEFTLGTETNTTGSFSNLAAGNYEVMILDESGCSEEVNFEITEPSEIEVQIVENANVDCFGENTGSFEISASGGVGNFEFNNGVETNSTGVFNNLTAGNYVVSISDANNCETTIQSTVSQPNELIAMISSQQDVNCFGDNSGAIALEANGGSGDITFELNGNSNTTGEFTNLSGGNYSIQVTDENNCETPVSFDIFEPSQLNIVVENINQASCSGQEGTIEVSANGGVGGYEFNVGSVTNTTGLFEGFSGGIYIVEVTDQSGCTESVEVDINEPNSLSASIAQSENVNCNGGNNGSVQVIGAGGIGAFTFTLGSESNSTGVFENLLAGNYSVILEDENNCNTSVSVMISEPDFLEIEVMNVLDVNCFEGADGAVNLSSVGGTGTIEYTLGSETNTTGEFTNLEGGNYNIEIQDENGCSNSMNIIVDTPQEIVPTIVNNQNITCAGEEDGMVELNATGGSNNFEYSYGTETNTTGIFSNIPPGSFTFFITDDNGCMEEVALTFDDPQPLAFEDIQVQNIGCDGSSSGMIQLVANGGSGNLNFTVGSETNSTGQFEIQAQGTYEVIVNDENDCTISTQVEVEETAEIQSSILNVTDVTCFGENNGTANFMANGGTGIIQFTLGNETNTTGTFENLEAGIYDVIINDDNNCFTELEIEITQPEVLEFNVEELNSIDCFGLSDGAIQVVALGGTGNLTYSLNNLTNTTGLFENLVAGTYEVLVEDGNGCSEIQNLTIDQPDEVSIEILNIIPEECAGSATGLVEVQGLNGAGNFVYQMNNETNTTGLFENLSGGNYDLLMTDGNGCELTTMITIDEESDISIESSSATAVSCFGDENGTINIIAGSPAGNLMYELDGTTNPTGVFENLASGVYEVVVSDANNCTETVSVEILEPTAINLDVVGIVPVDCFGESTGEAILDASGGVGEFSYTLNGEINNTGIFENLPAGIFMVDIIDSNGCTAAQEIEIEEPEELQITVISTTSDTGTGTAGSDGTVTLGGVGGVGSYLYSIDGINFQSGDTFILLEGGEYLGYVLDANGCVSQVVFIIESDIIDGIANLEQGVSKLEISPNPFSEFLYLNAELEIAQKLQLTMWTVSGIEIYSKKIDLQKGFHQINLDINNKIPAGSYFLKVRNENGAIGYFKLIKF